MSQRIVVIQGHPDPAGGHFAHALADAYIEGAKAAGHEVRRIEVATLDFPLLRTKQDYESGAPPETIRAVQDTIRWAGHIVIVYPMWMGEMPALLKAFLEQLLRPGFAYTMGDGERPQKLLAGRSARIVMTMGMPVFVYRWYFGAHGLKNLKRSILWFCGIKPIRASLIGMIESRNSAKRTAWLERLRALGRAGS